MRQFHQGYYDNGNGGWLLDREVIFQFAQPFSCPGSFSDVLQAADEQ